MLKVIYIENKNRNHVLLANVLTVRNKLKKYNKLLDTKIEKKGFLIKYFETPNKLVRWLNLKRFDLMENYVGIPLSIYEGRVNLKINALRDVKLKNERKDIQTYIGKVKLGEEYICRIEDRNELIGGRKEDKVKFLKEKNGAILIKFSSDKKVYNLRDIELLSLVNLRLIS